MTDYRPRRSVLYMPAANERALEKAKTIPADALIFDLEDAVAPDAKPAARVQACAAAASGAYGRREITIRCNGLDTVWGADDLRAAAVSGAAAVVIPKVGSTRDLAAVSAELDGRGRAGGDADLGDDRDADRRARRARDRRSSPRRRARDGHQRPRQGASCDNRSLVGHRSCHTSRRRCWPHASRARSSSTASTTTCRTPEGFRRECEQGVELGFDGKTLIHPGQVDIANDVWAPDEDEIAYARRVIEAFEAAMSEGRGVITVDGRMIENLHVDNARRTIAVAEAINGLD